MPRLLIPIIALLASAALGDEPHPRRVYVPLEDLDVILEHDQRGVMLNKAEFEKLAQLAEEESKKRPKPPAVAAAWTNAAYRAEAADDQLLLTVAAELEQFVSGWQRIVIPLPRVAVEQAKLDGEPALVGRGDNQALVLFSSGTGKHTLELQLTTELSAIGADRVAAFGLIPVPAGTLTLDVAAGKRLHVGGWQLPRPKPLAEPASYKVALGGHDSFHLRITDRGTDQAADVLVFATTGYGLHVMPGEVSWHALTTLQVFGKPLDRLTISAPNFLEIADVESSGLESWELADDPNKPDHAQLTLTYRQPFDGERKIHFKGVMATPTDAPWTVPTLTIANVTSQIGQVVVQYPAGVRLQTVEAAGVRRATTDQTPASEMPIDMGHLAAVEQWRFDFWQPEFTLRFLTQPRQRDVQTAVAAVLDVNSTGLDLEAALTVKTRFAPLFEVDLELPAEWTLLAVSRDNRPLSWHTISQEAGKHLWRIPLSPPLAADQTATVQLSIRREVEGWPVEAEPITVELPELVLPQSNLHEGTLIVRGDNEFDLAALDVVGLDAVPLKAEYERLRFQSQDTRYSGRLKVTRKPSRVAIESLSFTRLDPQTLHTFLQAVVEIQGGGVRTLRVELPEAVGTSLRFLAPGGPRIVEQTAASAANGVRLWTLQFDHRVHGKFALVVDLEQPRGDGEQWTVPEAKFLDADRQNGFIAIEASGEQRLTIDPRNGKQEKLADVDALDLPRSLYMPKERIIAVYRTVAPGAAVTLAEQRFEKEAVPTAVCRLLNMATVAARTGLQHRGAFQLNLVGVQSLSLKLPAYRLGHNLLKSQLWAVLVDGRPVEVRWGKGVYLIPLPANAQATERTLEVFYHMDSAGLENVGTLEQSPPELTVVTGTGESQPVVVLEQHWRLYHPGETLLVDSDGWLEPTTPLDGASWLGRWQDRLRRPTWKQLGESLLYALIAVVVVSLPILAYRRFGTLRTLLAGAAVGLLLIIGLTFDTFVAHERSNAINFTGGTPSAYYLNDDVQDSHAVKTAAPYAPPTNVTIQQPITEVPNAGAAGGELGGFAAYPQPGAAPASRLDMDFNAPRADAPVAGEDRPLTESERKRLESLGYAASDKEQPAKRNYRIVTKGKKGEAKTPAAARPASPLARKPSESKAAEPSAGDADGDLAFSDEPMPQEEFEEAQGLDARGGEGQAEQEEEDRRNIRQQEKHAQTESRMGLDELGRNQTSGLLSLSLDLSPPLGSQVKDFRYVGQGTGNAGAPLSLTYANRKSGSAFKIFLIALFALAAWLQRRSAISWKLAATVLGLALPLGLVTIAPLSWQAALDGVFFGTLVAAAVWIAESLCRWCERNCAWCCAAKTCALLAILFVSNTQLRAQETPAPTLAGSQPPKIIIPYEAGTDPAASERILLSQEKFLELYRKAHPDQPGTAPIDGGLVEALYAAKLDVPENKPEDAAVRVTARYAIRSYVNGQWSVALPLGAVALSSAKLDGKTAVVTPRDGGYVAVIPTAGLHVLDLEFSVAAKLTGAAGQFTLPLKAVPSGKLSFALPAKDLLVRVNGSSSVYRKVTKDDAATIELPVDQAGDTTIAWQPPQAKGGGAAVVHVDSATGATIGDAGVTLAVGLNYRVRQGTIQDVRFAFPANLKLQTVAGADVGGWELQESPEGRALRILFRRAVNDQTQLFVTLFLDQKIGDAAAEFELPTLTPQEITNEVGTVALYAGEQFQVSVGQVQGLTQIDTATFTPAMPVTSSKAPPRAAYRFAKRPFAATFQVGRQAAQGQLAAQHGVSVLRRKIQSTSRFHYQLTGAPRSALSYTLPKDFLPLEVRATSLADWFVDVRGETPVLTVQLGETRLGTVECVITGSRPRDPNAPAVEILLPQPLDVTRMESTLALWTDDSELASIQSSDGWRAIDANAAGPVLQRLRAKQAIRFAFQSSGAATKPVTLQLTRGEPKLKADSLVTTTVTEFTVVHALALQWQIDGAAVDMLSLTTPKSLSGRLDFQGPELREVVEVDAGNDRVRWTLWFRAPVSGKYFATALAALPPASDRIAAPAILCEQPAAGGQFAPIENQRQYVLLINGSQSQLSLADAALVETVQRDDLPIIVPQEQIDQGTELVRLKQLGAAPVWTMQKFAQTESIPASVNFADLTTVLARDGTYRTQVVYTIKNRRRQFLALRLPENTLLLSVMLQDQPARSVSATVGGKKAHLIALPKTSEADLSFPVKLVLAGRLPTRLPKKSSWQPQEIELPSPQVISQADDESFGIPVARTRWTVYLADDLDASAVMNPQKHNLTATTEGAGKLAYASSAIQEFNELLDVLENPSNPRQRDLALRNNLKQLGIVQHNYSGVSSDQTITAQQSAELAEQQRKVTERFSKVQRGLQSKTAPQAATAGSGAAPQQMLNFNDQSEVLNFAVTNNSAVLLGNGVMGITKTEAADDQFQLEVQEQAVPLSKPDQSAKPQLQQQSDFQTRGRYQVTNEANLGDLNARVSGKKMQQQSQAGRVDVDSLSANSGHVILSLLPESAELAEEFNELQRQKRYAEAEVAAKRLLELNPNNKEVATMLWKSRYARRDQKNQRLKIEKEESYIKQLDDVEQGRVVAPQNGSVIQFGGDWKDITERRKRRPNLPGPGTTGIDTNWNMPVTGTPIGQPGVPRIEGFGLVAGKGGMGGGAVDAEGDGIFDGTSNLAGWTQAGGLSLPIELPVAGQKLIYTKTGGDPKLTLSIRPKAALRFGLGVVWTAVWGIGALLLAAALRGPNAKAAVSRIAAWGLLLVGLAGACLLPGSMVVIALIAVAAGAFGVVWSATKPAAA